MKENMKKILCLAAVLVMAAACMTGCAGKNVEADQVKADMGKIDVCKDVLGLNVDEVQITDPVYDRKAKTWTGVADIVMSSADINFTGNYSLLYEKIEKEWVLKSASENSSAWSMKENALPTDERILADAAEAGYEDVAITERTSDPETHTAKVVFTCIHVVNHVKYNKQNTANYEFTREEGWVLKEVVEKKLSKVSTITGLFQSGKDTMNKLELREDWICVLYDNPMTGSTVYDGANLGSYKISGSKILIYLNEGENILKYYSRNEIKTKTITFKITDENTLTLKTNLIKGNSGDKYIKEGSQTETQGEEAGTESQTAA